MGGQGTERNLEFIAFVHKGDVAKSAALQEFGEAVLEQRHTVVIYLILFILRYREFYAPRSE